MISFFIRVAYFSNLMIKHQCVERKASFYKKNQTPASCKLRKNEQLIAIATDEISLPSSGHKILICSVIMIFFRLKLNNFKYRYFLEAYN
jgi:hypothetical protein